MRSISVVTSDEYAIHVYELSISTYGEKNLRI